MGVSFPDIVDLFSMWGLSDCKFHLLLYFSFGLFSWRLINDHTV